MRTLRGFARTEALAVLAIAIIAASLLLAGGLDTRRRARLASDLSNLHRIGALGAAYAADNRDLIWTFNWVRGRTPSKWPDLQDADHDLQAAANQAVDIMRNVDPEMPRIDGWFPHVLYNHLPLAAYAETPLPDTLFVSAADQYRSEAARNRERFVQGQLPPCVTSPPHPTGRRWPFSSSYQPPPANFDSSPVGERIDQDGNEHRLWNIRSGAKLSGRTFSEVVFPSQKTVYHDEGDRLHARIGLLFLDPTARVPMLMADLSAGVRTTSDSNWGWRPNAPESPSPTIVLAPGGTPTLCYPLVVTGGTVQRQVRAVYRFTRAGLAGIDFGGPEPRP